MVRAERIGLGGFPGRLGNDELFYYSLTNDKKIQAILTNWGARLLALNMPDREGNIDNVVLAYPNLEGYKLDESEIGSIAMSRWGNRISNAQYIDPESKQPIKLEANWRKHTLHSGKAQKRWSHRVWKTGYIGKNYVEFGLKSPNGEQGFPGEVDITLIIALNEVNELIFDYKAMVSGRTTPINIVEHIYWDLNGVRTSKGIQNHTIWTNADRYLPVTDDLIPKGTISPVAGTYLDFRRKEDGIGKKVLEKDAERLDNCLVFPKDMDHLVTVYSPLSGRGVTMNTDQECVQLYGGIHLGCTGLAIEAQRPVDIINQKELQKHFHNGFVKPGETYRQKTVFTFFTK